MISDSQIELAKTETKYCNKDVLHEHPDCIRIAYEWLDAQKKNSSYISKSLPIKHMIEKWGGRYVSTSDVEVAAHLHPDIRGRYPHFNISTLLTEPSKSRLIGIQEAYKHDYHKQHEKDAYKVHED